MAEEKGQPHLDWMFRYNADVPRGQIAVKPMPTPGTFLVMASQEVPDVAIVKAIIAFIARHEPAAENPDRHGAEGTHGA